MVSPSDWVAGVDGCPAGWLVVRRRIDAAASAEALLVSKFSEVLELEPGARIVAIDIPIGLPDRAGRGGRQADIDARANLGARHSSVFAVPARAAVMERDYGAACAVALAHSGPPLKVSKQTFHLFPKIREVDAVMTPALQARVVECHPELAFWAMNGERPLTEPKKVKSRPHLAGLALRRGLLTAAGYPAAFLESKIALVRMAGPDDLLDAAANSWSAVRIAQGIAKRFPQTPPCDARGLRMEIWG